MKPLAVLLLLLPALSGRALEWERQSLSLKAAPLQHRLEATFAFRNAGDRPVSITGVDTSCDCLEAVPSAHTFAPGAAGAIRARFNVNGSYGRLRRTIIVSTDDGRPPAALTVELEVPEIATLTPRSVDWKLDAPSTEATIDIVVAPELTLEISEVRPTSEAFTHRLETVTPGRHFRLHVAPKATAQGANAAFRIFARANTGEAVVVNAYANVR